MIVYGRNAVAEALRGRRRVHRLWATERAARAGELAETGVPLVREDAAAIAARCGSEAHQGVCCEADPFPYADPRALLALSDPVLVCLDEVADPQNLGSIARTAECAGAAGLVICERRAAHVTPAVCRASAGAVEHLPIARVSNLADYLGHARDAGLWCFGAAQSAQRSVSALDWSGGVVLVLGAEGRGLRPRVAAGCDELVSLPLRGRVGSLNVGAAAAALLYGILQLRLDTGT